MICKKSGPKRIALFYLRENQKMQIIRSSYPETPETYPYTDR